MRALFTFAASLLLAGAAVAQDNTGAISQSSQSASSSSSITTSSAADTSSMGDPPDNQGSAEMKDWIKSNESSTSTSTTSNSGFSVGFGRDNDDNADDQPRWSKHRPPRPDPEKMDGTYRIAATNGPFLCTVRLTASPYFGGYFASTSAGCPELWKVTRWELDGPSVVLTNSSGDAFATFWPRDRDIWVGRASQSGQRISLSR